MPTTYTLSVAGDVLTITPSVGLPIVLTGCPIEAFVFDLDIQIWHLGVEVFTTYWGNYTIYGTSQADKLNSIQALLNTLVCAPPTINACITCDTVGLAKEATQLDIRDNYLGSATTTPPTSGKGIIGWLRGVYDTLVGGIKIKNSSGTVIDPATETTLALIKANQTNRTQISQKIGGTTSGTITFPMGATVINTAFPILSANADRRGLIITNNSNKTVLICIGANATASLFTYSLATNGVVEIPEGVTPLSVSGIWTLGGAATGNLTLTIANI